MKTVSLEALIDYNRAVCDFAGQKSLVINESNLQSALSVQHHPYFKSDEEVACALFRSIIIGHGFKDGNKRTAFVCIQDILPPSVSGDVVEDVAVRCATGELKDVQDIVAELYP